MLKALRGEDPWEDLHPINITAKGTVKNPIIVKGVVFVILGIVQNCVLTFALPQGLTMNDTLDALDSRLIPIPPHT